jgi:hypothetical protein
MTRGRDHGTVSLTWDPRFNQDPAWRLDRSSNGLDGLEDKARRDAGLGDEGVTGLSMPLAYLAIASASKARLRRGFIGALTSTSLD